MTGEGAQSTLRKYEQAETLQQLIFNFFNFISGTVQYGTIILLSKLCEGTKRYIKLKKF